MTKNFETVEIPRRWGLIILALLGAIAFVVTAGGLLIVDSGAGIADKSVFALGGVFFGYCAYVMLTRTLRNPPMEISMEGIHAPMVRRRKILIRWSDIEEISWKKISRQNFTTIRLSDYSFFLSQISERDASAAIREMKFLLSTASILLVISEVNDDSDATKELTDILRANGNWELSNYALMLASMRRKYGFEFLLGWHMRDRAADKFADYLNGFKSQSS